MEEKKAITKETLVEKAQELANSENLSTALRQVRDLKKQWRRLSGEEESLYDMEMNEKFYGFIDAINAKVTAAYSSVEDKKKEIIENAKKALEMTNMKKASNAMNDLMEEWKASGRAAKEVDDELWNEFTEVRNAFFDKKKAYYDNLAETFAANKAAKEALIARIKEVNLIENIKEKTAAFNEVMEEWKKSGSAGRETDDELWKEFSAERKQFYASRNAYYDNLKETFSQRTEAKKEIISQAKINLARSEFTDEEVESMKALRNKWKEVGNAGKENEEALWQEFNDIMKRYFDNMRDYRK